VGADGEEEPYRLTEKVILFSTEDGQRAGRLELLNAFNYLELRRFPFLAWWGKNRKGT